MSSQPQRGSTNVPLLRMARFEWLLGRRTVAWRAIALLSFLYGCSMGHVQGTGAGAVAYEAGDVGCKLMSLVAIVWISMHAVRDTAARTRTLVFTKPQPGESLAIAKFVGGFAHVASYVLALFLGAILTRVLGGTPPSLLVVFLPQLGRSLATLFFVSAFSFTLALLSDSAIAGLLVGLYIVMIMAGKDFLAKVYDPTTIQNLPAYITLGMALLGLVLRFYASARRGSRPAPTWLLPDITILLLYSAFLFYSAVMNGHDTHTHQNPSLELIAAQDTEAGQKAAGFLFPDQNGRPTTLSQFNGRILVVALWSPQDIDSAAMLHQLQSVQSRYGFRGVQVVAVCLSEDNSAAWTFAVGEDLHYPVVTDWGTMSVPEKLAMSPIAGAYRTTALPAIVVTDRRRRIVDIIRGTSSSDGRTIDQMVEERLALQPR